MSDNNKQTTAPLPGAKTAKQRGDALRRNLAKRKQQARARDDKKDTSKE